MARAPRGLRYAARGRGTWARAMGRIFRNLPPGPVVIVGSDVPGITPARVAAAFRLLGAHDWVFGPAPDGGYWLVGARRRPALRLPFAGVRWSSEHALADTLANLKDARVGFLEELRDVDTGADLARIGSADRTGTISG